MRRRVGTAVRSGSARRLRRALDLEDWPAFDRSFDAMVDLIADIGHRPGAAPATITLLSGDIHFSYAAGIQLAGSVEGSTRITQVVSSPIRNALMPHERRAIRSALAGPAR